VTVRPLSDLELQHWLLMHRERQIDGFHTRLVATFDQRTEELERAREQLNIATRCLSDILANGHRRTGPACAGFALTAMTKIAALDPTEDDWALDTREPPPPV